MRALSVFTITCHSRFMADVGLCATTSDTEAHRHSSERKATTALVAQVPRPAVSGTPTDIYFLAAYMQRPKLS